MKPLKPVSYFEVSELTGFFVEKRFGFESKNNKL